MKENARNPFSSLHFLKLSQMRERGSNASHVIRNDQMENTLCINTMYYQHCDGQSVIYLTYNQVYHVKTNHFFFWTSSRPIILIEGFTRSRGYMHMDRYYLKSFTHSRECRWYVCRHIIRVWYSSRWRLFSLKKKKSRWRLLKYDSYIHPLAESTCLCRARYLCRIWCFIGFNVVFIWFEINNPTMGAWLNKKWF
jgi:hypothetical protein